MTSTTYSIRAAGSLISRRTSPNRDEALRIADCLTRADRVLHAVHAVEVEA